MEKDYARFILEKTITDYNLISQEFSRTRKYNWEELNYFKGFVDQGQKVLDLGCGNGRLYELLRDKGIDYYGTDVSEELIGIARASYPEGKFKGSDPLKIPFESAFFDAVFCIAVFHHIPSKEFRIEFLEECKRVLKPGGFLIITAWNLYQKKTGWRLLLKHSALKLLGQSKLDFKDILFPWKDSSGKPLTERYYHLFTKREITGLLNKAGFQVKQSGILARQNSKENNIYAVAIKSP